MNSNIKSKKEEEPGMDHTSNPLLEKTLGLLWVQPKLQSETLSVKHILRPGMVHACNLSPKESEAASYGVLNIFMNSQSALCILST